MKSRRYWLWGLLSVIILSFAAWSAWAAYAPVEFPSREEVFTIPKGTWASRMSGKQVEILPSKVYLMLEVRDILVLKNEDNVPQIFGPTLIMPGQSFSLPFALASDYQFECTAHASGQMSVIVEPFPSRGWERLAWRVKSIARKLNSLKS